VHRLALLVLSTSLASGAAVLTTARDPGVASRLAQFEISHDGGRSWTRKKWCGGLIVQARDPERGEYILTASHCLEDLGKAENSGARLRAQLGTGKLVDLDAASLRAVQPGESLTSRRQALGMDFAYVALPRSRQARVGGGPDAGLTPLQVHRGEKLVVFGPDRQHTCRVDWTCGSQIHLTECDQSIVEGISGSPLWASRGGKLVLAGVVTKGNDIENAAATNYSAILGKSSFLFAEPGAPSPDAAIASFVNERSLRQRYRYPRSKGTYCQRSSSSLVELVHQTPLGQGRYVGLVSSADGQPRAYDNGARLICDLRAGRREGCRAIDTPGIRTGISRGLTKIAEGRLVARYDNGTAIEIVEADKAWKVARVIDAASDPAGGYAVTNVVEDALDLNGDLLLAGEGGVCLVEASSCRLLVQHGRTRGEAVFLARRLVRVGAASVLALGRDTRQSSPTSAKEYVPACALYVRTKNTWNLEQMCRGLGDDLRGINTGVNYKNGVLAFSSSGAAVFISPDLKTSRVAMAGLLFTYLQGVNQLDDAVRDVEWVAPGKLLAMVSSDGAFRIAKIDQTAGGRISLKSHPCTERRDLALWLTGLAVLGPGRGAVTSQAGEVFEFKWPNPEVLSRQIEAPGDSCIEVAASSRKRHLPSG
jgi:hypothetical protein